MADAGVEAAEVPPPPPAAAGGRKPLQSLTRAEFYVDLLAFLRANGEGHLIAESAEVNPTAFPEKKLNGRHLDLFSLYKQVTMRGGFLVRSGGRHPFSWSGEIFPNMKHNYTRNHRATSVGHDLIKYYGTYLSAYEQAHPKDVIPYGVVGTPHSASAAVRAAAAPLKPGDRIEVWWPIDKAWFAATVLEVQDGEGKVEVSYDDGDRETLQMAQERWRRERVLGHGPSKKKRPAEGGGGGGGAFGGGEALPAGAKRQRKRTTFFQSEAFGGMGGGGAVPQRAFAQRTFAQAEPEDPIAASLARVRARAEQRRLMLAPVTRRTAAVLAASAPMRFPPASSVAHWLQLRGFAVLAPLFDAHEIDMEVLPQLTGEDLEDMGLDDFRTRIELLVHVTQECNSRAMDEVDADLDAMTEKQGERLAGVRETTLAVEVEEAAEDEAAAEEGEQDVAAAEAGAACALGGDDYVMVDATATTAPSWPAPEACDDGAAALDAAPAGALDVEG